MLSQAYFRPTKFVLFIDIFVDIFNHSYGYAEKFRLALNKNELQLIRHNTHDLTLVKKVDFIDQPMIIPAMVADKSEAMEPPIKAFIPNSDNIFLCPGARDPIPPI